MQPRVLVGRGATTTASALRGTCPRGGLDDVPERAGRATVVLPTIAGGSVEARKHPQVREAFQLLADFAGGGAETRHGFAMKERVVLTL